MADYLPTIGLEVHAELRTKTKMFCSSKNDPDEERPNANVCPVCLAHPGTLPVVNREAVRLVLKVGQAISGTLADYTEFDRKSYFYPDIPKGYQISQYEHPLVKGGKLHGVEITRIHLEEDTATSRHGGTHSIVDFNRAGVPLMELVTEPVIHDAETAGNFARELQLLLRTLGAGEANMEKGQMRVEANISVSRDQTLGTKTEVKNLNSFRSVERAIKHEVERQISVLEAGGTLVQETRGFNEDTGETFSQRLKESSHDYRYFPDPDIPKFRLSLIQEFSKSEMAAGLPELPWERRARYQNMGVKPADVEVMIADADLNAFFDAEILSQFVDPKLVKLASNYLLSDVRSAGYDASMLHSLGGGRFADLIRMVDAKELSSRGAKDLLLHMMKEEGTPKDLAATHGLLQDSSGEAVDSLADRIIQENQGVADGLKAGGKPDALKFLVGQGMKLSKGAINPELLMGSLKKKLGLS